MPIRRHRQARRHGMATAGDEQPCILRREHGGPQIDAGQRAARALADAIFAHRDDDRRAVQPVLQPRGDDADDAGVPAGAGDQRDRQCSKSGSAMASAASVTSASMLRRSTLSRSSSAASAMASAGSSVVSSRTPRSDLPTRPPALTRGPSAKPRSRATGGFGEAGNVDQRGQPDVAAGAHDLQALRDKGAVEPGQRHDIGNGAERDDIEQLGQLGSGRVANAPRWRSVRLSATTSRKATPTAARWPWAAASGASSRRLGLTSASASGSAVEAWW